MVSFVAYYLHDRIVSLRGEVWAHTTSLTPPLFIDVLVPNQVMYMCVRVQDLLFLLYDFAIEF